MSSIDVQPNSANVSGEAKNTPSLNKIEDFKRKMMSSVGGASDQEKNKFIDMRTNVFFKGIKNIVDHGHGVSGSQFTDEEIVDHAIDKRQVEIFGEVIKGDINPNPRIEEFTDFMSGNKFSRTELVPLMKNFGIFSADNSSLSSAIEEKGNNKKIGMNGEIVRYEMPTNIEGVELLFDYNPNDLEKDGDDRFANPQEIRFSFSNKFLADSISYDFSKEFSQPESTQENKQAHLQNIQNYLNAAQSYDQQHWDWQRNKEIAETSGSPVPEEPQPSPEAVRGQELSKLKDVFSQKTREIFSGKGLEKFDKDFNKLLDQIKNTPDEEQRIMQSSGVIDGIKNNLYPQKWEQVSAILDVAPESMVFGELYKNFYPLAFSEFGNNNPHDQLKNKATQNVLSHLSSEISPLPQTEKDKLNFYIEEGKGIKSFDSLFQANGNYVNKNIKFTPEQFIAAFDLGNKLTVTDVTNASKELNNFLTKNYGAMNDIASEALLPNGIAATVESSVLLLSEIIKQKPELSTDINGKLVGYCRALLEKRPDITNSKYAYGSYEREALVLEYQKINRIITTSFANLYDPNTTNIIEVLNAQKDNFEKEFSEILKKYNLRDFNGNDAIGQNYREYLRIIDTARQKEKDDQTEMQNEKKEQQKKSVEDLVQKFTNSNEVKTSFWNLLQTDVSKTDDSLKSTLTKLNETIINSSDSSDIIDFATNVANKFSEFIKDVSLVKQVDKETSRRTKGFIRRKEVIQYERSFPVVKERLDQLLKQAQNEILTNPNPDNYAKLEALKCVSQRGAIKYGYNTTK